MDRHTPLRPPSDRPDWLAATRIVLVIIAVVDELEMHLVRVCTFGAGGKQYPPRLLLERSRFLIARLIFFAAYVASCGNRGGGGRSGRGWLVRIRAGVGLLKESDARRRIGARGALGTDAPYLFCDSSVFL